MGFGAAVALAAAADAGGGEGGLTDGLLCGSGAGSAGWRGRRASLCAREWRPRGSHEAACCGPETNLGARGAGRQGAGARASPVGQADCCAAMLAAAAGAAPVAGFKLAIAASARSPTFSSSLAA